MSHTASITTLILGTLCLAACKGDTEDTQTVETGDTAETEGHPLVPEKYKYLWKTDACTAQDGSDGIQLYVLSEDAVATPAGKFTATEKWFWFHGTGDYSDDCVDTFEVNADYFTLDYSQFNCGECDEAFWGTRTLVDRTCNYTYYTLHGWDPEEFDPPDEEIYEIVLLFDEVGPSGNPNIDNKMLVVQNAFDPSGGRDLNIDFAWGHIYPTGEEYSLPANYDYLREDCLTTGD